MLPVAPQYALDEYEQELEANIEQQFALTPEAEAKEKVLLRRAAIHSTQKQQQVGLRINKGVLDMLKHIAKHNGIKYQTLINSVLYKYVHAHAKEAYE